MIPVQVVGGENHDCADCILTGLAHILPGKTILFAKDIL
jgi:hypothetical protein